MCTYTMESIVDPCDSMDGPEFDPDWLNKYIETENVFLDYLKSLTFTSPSNVDTADSVLPEYDGTESGFEALDNLCDLLVSLCDTSLSRHESIDSGATIQSQDDKKKQEPRNKRSLKCLSSHYGKELQVSKPNRARSHSSVGVDEILRTQDLSDIGASESRRKSRRVSLGMRPRFSNWSKVKGAFKRDKSNSRADSRDEYPDVVCYSGDEGIEKVEPHSSSSHENTGQMSSSEEEFEYYTDGFFNEAGIAYQIDDVNVLRNDGSDFANGTPENTLLRSKSHVLQPQSHSMKSSNSPNVNSPSHKNPFKWYRTKSITPTGTENGMPEAVSNPPSPFKNSRFLYDDESVSKINDDPPAEPSNSEEVLQEVQNKYEWLQKRLSREFYEKYHDWRRIRDAPLTNDDEDKTLTDFEVSKLSPYLEDRNLSPGFKQKFQEWQKLKGLSLSPTRAKMKINENPNTLKKSKSDWHKWRPGSKSESNVLRFLGQEQGKPNPPEKKELAWLEKELQKVAREKQRLEKEKEKYAERETRLQNMKRAIKSGRKRKQEVVVPTSTGLYRFQGISSKFTRKLYEWEKAKGITAESSTFALLDPYYSGPKIQRNAKPQISDTIASLSRSRSVGSVDVAGVGTSILQSASMNHQQSSLSLNDMEQLEEAHLQVENDNLMQSTVQLFDNEDVKELDLITNESLDIPDYSKDDISPNIPILSSSSKSLRDSNYDPSILCSRNFAKQVRNDRKLSDGYGTDSENLYCSYPGDTMYEISPNKQQRDTANADAENIVNQIKKLRAGTSLDDQDRINTLTNLQHLADQLLEMVHNMNNKKNENVDELAGRIAELAIELKNEIKNLTTDELQASYSSEKISSKKLTAENFNTTEYYCPEDVYTDTEENDSPTVHCTFTLPSWRVKHTTPSSTESESSNTRNKYADAKPSKNERHRKHYKEDNSSGGDENYDGGDETTVYLDLRSIKTKDRRESSDNISTSNSESMVSTEPKYVKNCTISPEPIDNEEVLYCSLTLDSHSGNEIKTNYCKEKRLNAIEPAKCYVQSDPVAEGDRQLYGSDNEDQTFKTEVRSYSPKPVSSKRKCTSCGKVKRISKSRKSTNNYCPCGKKESAKTEPPKKTEPKVEPVENAEQITKSASYSNTEDFSNNRKLGKISRSKVYDFKSLTDIDKSNTDSEICKIDNAINVIVPTTRKIFAPLKQDENGGTSAVVSFTINECEDGKKHEEKNHDPKFIAPPWISDRAQSASPSTGRKELKEENAELANRQRKKTVLEMHANVDKLPPASPLSTKRNLNKDGNSSIRMMIAHYNKLMSEKPERRASEGNCWTPSLQKSPVLERRYRFEHLKAESDNNIRKSKSAVLSVKNQKTDKSSPTSAENSTNCLSKSSSAGSIHYVPLSTEKLPEKISKVEEPMKEATLHNSASNESHTSQLSVLSTPSFHLERNSSFESVVSETKLRNLKLQEAKNKFFNEYPTKITIEYLPKRVFQPTKLEGNSEAEKKNQSEEKRDFTSETESNFNLILNKSISTGAIDDRTRTCNLPMCEKSPSKSKFGFSSIASKFRKVKMRRHKDPEMNAVSSLCRASLLVNLGKDGKPKEYHLNSSKSCPSSPVMQRSISKRNSSSN